MKALAGAPALAALDGRPRTEPVRGGPVRIGFVGVGGQGRALLGNVNPAFGRVVAMADINPASLQKADEVLVRREQLRAAHYVDVRDLLEHESIEAVIVAVPLWAHADVVTQAFAAGKHVLCEKMMAWDVAGCERMIAAAGKAGTVFEVGYQRHYNPSTAPPTTASSDASCSATFTTCVSPGTATAAGGAPARRRRPTTTRPDGDTRRSTISGIGGCIGSIRADCLRSSPAISSMRRTGSSARRHVR